MPHEGPPQNERAAQEDRLDLHNENLFDEDQDRSGEKTNLATGENFYEKNTRDDAPENPTSIVEPGEKDALPEIEESEDDAARWLRKNDPDRR